MRWGDINQAAQRLSPVLTVLAGAVVVAFLVALWWQYIPPVANLMLLSGAIGLGVGSVCGLLAGGLCAMSQTSELIEEGIGEIERAYEKGRRDGRKEALECRQTQRERIGA